MLSVHVISISDVAGQRLRLHLTMVQPEVGHRGTESLLGMLQQHQHHVRTGANRTGTQVVKMAGVH